MTSTNQKVEAFEATINDQVEMDEIEELQKEWENDMDNNLIRFKYATILSHSKFLNDRREAIIHFEYLINQAPEYLRDSLFYLGRLRFGLKEFDAARACAEELLRIDPDNEQVKNMHIAAKHNHEKQVREKAERQQEVGIAVGVGLAVTAIAAIGFSLLARRRK
mmetsp:Transcript_995/g.1045  ORF Transcript_995/g.1045 Transcript_995/m.1045 type:complete len:164 (+) Transcript_995:64-555(+)|eukprot:CAMPEP_0173150052 /NCGR_PEP_ID=MMETSP1105-20130129/10712_1 /TAXON_ID=2985 /ORGANISM="Ochromonas sp., Strain BG-1" /LENGTH=163 /DNA_ID=CAMNT_0014065077 /DNA_START=47 /DNA_END=538 /DNA_ORIENTATION=+